MRGDRPGPRVGQFPAPLAMLWRGRRSASLVLIQGWPRLMEILLACLERNDLPVPDAPWLWLGAGLLLLGLALAGVYGLFALARRGRDRLEGHLLWLDGLLSRRAPRPWNFVKSRF